MNYFEQDFSTFQLLFNSMAFSVMLYQLFHTLIDGKQTQIYL